MRATIFFLAAASASVLGACSSGLGTGNDAPPPTIASSSATGLGLDLGFELTDPIADDVAVAGALIPGITPDDDRRVSFLAFSTATPNDDADGTGTGASITRTQATPADSNGASDVYLVAFEDELDAGGGSTEQPVAFSRALINVFRHNRCTHCHGLGTLAGPGEDPIFPNEPHPGGAEPVTTDECVECHIAANVPDLAGVEWRAPREANGDFDFRSNTLFQLAEKAQRLSFDEHLLNDGRVRWAIESGNVPFVPAAAGGNAGTSERWNGLGRDAGRVPITFGTFQAQLRAWEAGGFQTTAEGSVRDVVLVSRSRSANRAANGASSSPSITWVPNPAFVPSSPAQPAGTIVVAFASAASDLVAGGSTVSDVYVTEIDVFVDRDPATGASSPGALDLVSTGTNHTLVSERVTGGVGGNADSIEPALDGSGRRVVFESAATNLVAGFSNQNGPFNDVYLRDLDLTSTTLVSATTPGGAIGGDGRSEEAAISPTGVAIAFSSQSTNLAPGDTNGFRDIFYTQRVSGALLPLERASVRSDGGEGVGGTNHEPQVVVLPSGVISVAFESEMTNLAPIAAPVNVFLHEDGRTTLLSRRTVGGTQQPGNGVSSAPRISPTGEGVVFTTSASNLDAERTNDANGVSDVLYVDLRPVRAGGITEGRRLSLDSMSRDAGSASRGARVTTFRDATGSYENEIYAAFRSNAEELGATRQDVVAAFPIDAAPTIRTDFIADVPEGPAPLVVQFTDTSNGAPGAWSWDFGDGGTSSDQSPMHTYAAPGSYDVSLTVTRESGTTTTVKPGFIRAVEPLQVVTFDATALSGPRPLQTSFSATLQGNQENVSYLWRFGDGQTSPDESPTHVYQTEGTFDVTLEVSGLGGSDDLTRVDYIDVLPPSGANFTFSDQGLRVDFMDQSSGNPSSWSWDFGDGGTSMQQNPQHTYADNGLYQVTLTINGPGGMDSITIPVDIDAPRFSTVYSRFAANGCNSCHGSSSPGGGLRINDTAANLYDALVGVPAQGDDCSSSGILRVAPFNAAGSLTMQVVDPNVTACNGGVAMGTWGVSDRNALRAWIDQGALE
ncbi:MAG: PKD domain-containing protein [Planctomycetota bacterium]